MRVPRCVYLFLLLAHTYLEAGAAVADTTAFIPSLRYELDMGGEIFGYRGALLSAYGRPAAFTVGGRIGDIQSPWTFGIRLGQAELDDINFRGEYHYDGRLRPVDANVVQRNTLYTFDLRRDFGTGRRVTAFADAGLTLNRMILRLCLHEPDRRRDDEDAFVNSFDLHRDMRAVFSAGAGVRLNLSGLANRAAFSTEDFAFLELRAGYAFGGDTSFVLTAEQEDVPLVPPRTSHALYRKPITASPAEAFYVRFTLGFRLSG